MISIEQVTVEFGGSPLFDNIGFLINPKDKIALVGKNGAGKTTLLKLISGKQNPIAQNLAVMDATAFALCRDQKLPINVFSIFKPGALKRVVCGENEGTLVYC